MPILSVVVALLAGVPLVLFGPAPLQDWPGHLARVHILADMLGGDTGWDRYYTINTFFLPNVALDLGLLGLLRLGLPLYAAASVFLAVTYLLFVSGFCALARALGALDRAKPLFAALLFFGSPLFWGFVNYTFGFALMLWMLAAWVSARRYLPDRLAIGLAAVGLLFFCHVIPTILFIGLAGCFEIVALLRGPRRWPLFARQCLALLPAMLLFLLLLSHSPTSHNPPVADSVGGGELLGFLRRKASIFAKMLLGGGLAADAISLATIVTIAAMAWFGRLRLPGPALFAFAATLALGLVAPQGIGGAGFLDLRLAEICVVVLLAAGHFTWPSGRSRSAFHAALALLILARTAAIGVNWHADQAVYAEYDALVATLPAGSMIVGATAVAGEHVGRRWWSPPIGHLADTASLRGMVVPSVFADATQQPLIKRADLRPWELGPVVADGAALTLVARQLRHFCPPAAPGVDLLVIYPLPYLDGLDPGVVIARRRDFALLDACRLAAGGGAPMPP